MEIQRLKISNFRNLESLELLPAAKVNLISGDNGAGKTSVLEAIFYCCTGRSFRATTDDPVMRRGATFSRVEVNGLIDEEQRTVAVAWGDGEKKHAKVDGVRLTRLADLLGHFQAVAFVPEDVELVYGPPGIRRRLLDIYISQIDQKYLRDLIEYQRVLAQRNALLKDFSIDEEENGSAALLDSWDQQLARSGARLVAARQQMVEECTDQLKHYFELLSQPGGELVWSYEPSTGESGTDPEQFHKRLHDARRRDINFGATSVGPHRDDLSFTLGGSPARNYASQGEAKAVALSAKFAIFDWLSAKLEERPLLLLDELGSQLDARRLGSLLELLPDLGQVFLTAARPGDLRKAASIAAEIKLAGGKLVVE